MRKASLIICVKECLDWIQLKDSSPLDTLKSIDSRYLYSFNDSIVECKYRTRYSVNNLGFERTRKHIASGDGTSQVILVGVDDKTRDGKAI